MSPHLCHPACTCLERLVGARLVGLALVQVTAVGPMGRDALWGAS